MLAARHDFSKTDRPGTARRLRVPKPSLRGAGDEPAGAHRVLHNRRKIGMTLQRLSPFGPGTRGDGRAKGDDITIPRQLQSKN